MANSGAHYYECDAPDPGHGDARAARRRGRAPRCRRRPRAAHARAAAPPAARPSADPRTRWCRRTRTRRSIAARSGVPRYGLRHQHRRLPGGRSDQFLVPTRPDRSLRQLHVDRRRQRRGERHPGEQRRLCRGRVGGDVRGPGHASPGDRLLPRGHPAAAAARVTPTPVPPPPNAGTAGPGAAAADPVPPRATQCAGRADHPRRRTRGPSRASKRPNLRSPAPATGLASRPRSISSTPRGQYSYPSSGRSYPADGNGVVQLQEVVAPRSLLHGDARPWNVTIIGRRSNLEQRGRVHHPLTPADGRNRAAMTCGLQIMKSGSSADSYSSSVGCRSVG